MKKLLSGSLKLFGLFVVLAVIMTINMRWGLFLSLTTLAYGGVAMARALPGVGRGFAVAVSAVALFFVIGTSFSLVDAYEAHLDALKASDPDAYLAELAGRNEAAWLMELRSLRPDEYAAEMQRRADLEEQERQRRRAEACGAGNSILAFVMQQDAVRSQLRAPSTARFPSYTSASIEVLDGCMFRTVSYVDAQNAFGAMLRSNYVSVIKHFPDSDSWRVQSVVFLE